MLSNLIVFLGDFAPQPRPGQVRRLSLEAVLVHQPGQQLLVNVGHGESVLKWYCFQLNKMTEAMKRITDKYTWAAHGLGPIKST